jgi:hypothetical protein
MRKGQRPTGTKQGTTFLDSNPLNHTTTVFIGRPGPGDWDVTVDKGSLGVTKFTYAKSLPPIKWGAVKASVGQAKNARATVAAAKRISIAKIPVLERKRLRKLTVKTPPGSPKLVILDAGPGGSKVLGKTDGGSDKTAITFDPLADGGKHAIRAIALHPNGLPRAAHTLLKYVSPKAATPARPKIVAVQRKSHSAILVLDTDPAPKGTQALAFLVLAKTSDGAVLRLPVLRNQVKKLGSKWAITLPGVDKGARLDLQVAGAFDGAYGAKAKISSKGR